MVLGEKSDIDMNEMNKVSCLSKVCICSPHALMKSSNLLHAWVYSFLVPVAIPRSRIDSICLVMEDKGMLVALKDILLLVELIIETSSSANMTKHQQYCCLWT